jgi:two-component system sensor histidine kinase RegB
MTGPDAPFLRTLCSLRWLAVGGQAATILVATWVLGLPLPQLPLWAGVAVLALFNIYTQLRPEAADTAPLTAFGHILVDVIILTWMVGWSGGMANPFSSLFLILIALAAFALPLRWALAVALACLLGYAASGIFGQPCRTATSRAGPQPLGRGRQLPDLRGGRAGLLHPAGAGAAPARTGTLGPARALRPQRGHRRPGHPCRLGGA